MSTHNTWRLTGALGGLLLAATSAFSQGVFIDRFKDGVLANADREPGFWTNPSVWPCYAQELNDRLKLHPQNPTTSSFADACLIGALGWEGNFIRNVKTYSVRGITLGSDGAFVFALNSQAARENAATASDALVLRLDKAGNNVRLDWKLNASGDPTHSLYNQNMTSPVHAFVLTLTATNYTLTIIHEDDKTVVTGGYGTGWDASQWDNNGDASMVLRGLHTAASVAGTDISVEAIEVGGASFIDPFSDSTPANVDTYLPSFWTPSVVSPGTVTESGGNLVLRAQAASASTNANALLLSDLSAIGNFTRWPKTYVLNATTIAGNTTSTANRELVFALNSVKAAEDGATASDAIQLRLGGDNHVNFGWKLNSAGAPANTLVNQTISSAVTGARLTLDPWRYTLTVTKSGGSNTFGAPYGSGWNPSQWDNSGNSSVLLRANRIGNSVANSYAEGALTSVTLFEPGFYSDFESGNLATEGWISESNPGRLSFVASPVLNGANAIRCEVQSGDANVSSGKRTEIARHKIGGQGLDRWYSFAVYLENWDYSPYGEIIAQWMEVPDAADEQAKGPTLTIGTENGKWLIETRWDDRYTTPVGEKQVHLTTIYNDTLAASEKGQWVDFVVHAKWSAKAGDTNGLIEIWKNGTLVATQTGPNCYNSLKDIYFKAGIYRYTWNTNVPSDETITKRVLYLDAVKMADDYIGASGMRPQ